MVAKNPSLAFLRSFAPRDGRFVELSELIEVYARYLLTEADAYAFPVNLGKVLEHHGLEALAGSLLGQRGAITLDLKILYNVADSQQVQTFSQAHELIEALITAIVDYDPQWLDDDQIQELLDRKEHYCESGAAAILMPLRFFKPYIKEYGFSMQIAIALARASGLSLTTVSRRMLETGLRQAAFIIWRYGYKPSDFVASEIGQMTLWGSPTSMDPPKKLRVNRIFASPTITTHIKEHKSVEDTTAIAKAFQSSGNTVVQGYDYLEISSRPDFYLTENIPASYDGQPRVMSFVYFDDCAEEQFLFDE